MAETGTVFDAFDEFLCVVCSFVNVQQRAAESNTFSFTVVGVWNETGMCFFFFFLV